MSIDKVREMVEDGYEVYIADGKLVVEEGENQMNKSTGKLEAGATISLFCFCLIIVMAFMFG